MMIDRPLPAVARTDHAAHRTLREFLRAKAVASCRPAVSLPPSPIANGSGMMIGSLGITTRMSSFCFVTPQKGIVSFRS